jgi:hypothetical protein
MTEICQRCKEEDEDLRIIQMCCMYDMEELRLPFQKQKVYIKHLHSSPYFFTLTVCKRCRADWMLSLKDWFDSPIKRKSCGSGIFIRSLGNTIEVTEEEFQKIYPGKVPVICKE